MNGEVITIPATVKVRQALAGGWGPEREVTELRSTPVSGKAMHWAGSRLTWQGGVKRRTRQHWEIWWSPDGWHSDSGSGERPMCRATCCTVMGYPGGVQAFQDFHEEHPVEWKVKTTEGQWSGHRFYCDPHLPQEYRDLTDPE